MRTGAPSGGSSPIESRAKRTSCSLNTSTNSTSSGCSIRAESLLCSASTSWKAMMWPFTAIESVLGRCSRTLIPASSNRAAFLFVLCGRSAGTAVASVCRGAEAVQRFAILERGPSEVTIDNRKASFAAHDVRQQGTGDGFRRKPCDSGRGAAPPEGKRRRAPAECCSAIR